jgi:N-methylhydantoinase B
MDVKFDPITLEVMRNAIYAITDEMMGALIRTAYSTNIKDRRDCSCCFFLPDKRVVAQSEISATPLHLASILGVVDSVLDAIPPETMDPGDHILYNKPYPEGPGHMNDITLISPVFYEGELFALVANQAHHVDVGGFAPGSMPFGISEIFQEGIQIPAIKIVRKGVVAEDILELISDNVRTKDEFKGDVMAQVACNNIGEQRLSELLEKYGKQMVLFYMNEIMDYSERRIREAIRKAANGIYSFEDFIEGDGFTDDLIKIKCTVEIKDEDIYFDFTGTSPQVRGPLNCRKKCTAAGPYYVTKAMFDPEVPPNDGAYRPIHIHIPDGSLLNCDFPHAVVQANIITSPRIADVLIGALLQALPERGIAACHGTINILNIGGMDTRTGRLFNYIETYGGGQGAMHNQDGMDGVHSHMSNTQNAPVEVIESTYPLQVVRYGLVCNSEGAGKFRGGMGIMREFIVLEDDLTLTVGSDRENIKPWGVDGGSGGQNSENVLIHDGKEKRLSSKMTTRIKKGDSYITVTPGGGGWGEPFERDPEKLLWDVSEGLISIERAESEYGVIFKEHGGNLEIDQEATERTRAGKEKQH